MFFGISHSTTLIFQWVEWDFFINDLNLTVDGYKDSFLRRWVNLSEQRRVNFTERYSVLLKRKIPYQDSSINYEEQMVKRNAPRWIKALAKFGYL